MGGFFLVPLFKERVGTGVSPPFVFL